MDKMEYSHNKKYGENVYCGWTMDTNTKIKARDCVDRWYSEINQFSFGREPEELKCGHFTQIVWKTTKELGIGSAKSKSGKLYVVANYHPPGNWGNQFAKNVLPPGAMQFRTTKYPESPKGSNNNVPVSSPTQRNSKNLGGIASDLVNKLKSTSVSGDKFEDAFLRAHNEFRSNHGVPPLKLNKKLCKYAEEWAKTLVKIGKMEHREQDEYGENIFYAWSSDPNFDITGKEPVEKWYSEIKDHAFGREPTSLGSGHFTQVIWEDTQEVGVGMARSKDGQIYVVGNYYPPGNVVGSFANKVRPPIS
ncbi:ectin [Aphomia sociella]